MKPLFALAIAAALGCGCGGAPFTTLDDRPDAAPLGPDAGELAALVDAGAGDADPPADVAVLEHAGDASEDSHSVELEHDAGDVVDAFAPPPPVDAGEPPDVYVAPPPPPALCCATPCGGSQVAAITCGNGGDWTCGGSACSAGGCAVGNPCAWMAGSCTGRVEVCP